VRPPRVADRCDMVDVDAEPQGTGSGHARLPGFIAGISASSGGTFSGS
jgi:hypothetical protein